MLCRHYLYDVYIKFYVTQTYVKSQAGNCQNDSILQIPVNKIGWMQSKVP